jgi:hypothetical protein
MEGCGHLLVPRRHVEERVAPGATSESVVSPSPKDDSAFLPPGVTERWKKGRKE